MTFNDIIGHERPIRILRRALAGGTLAHAYLFSGQEGIGKRMTAFALAAAANCTETGPDACGACPSCRKVAGGTHPDVRSLVPDGTEIKIDQVREAQAVLALRPFEGAKKVLVIDRAEAMNAAASNALLKTLEEPPGDALLILVTATPQALLPTIRSRCQELRFQPLSRAALAQVLREKRGLSEPDAWFAAAVAQGSVGAGMETDVAAARAERDGFLELWLGLAQAGADQLLKSAEALSKDREQFERLIEIGIERLRDLTVRTLTGDDRLLVYPHPRLADAAGGGVSVRSVLADVDLLRRSKVLLDKRVSGQLVAEHIFLNMGKG